jgi:putative MATE family efflux protein
VANNLRDKQKKLILEGRMWEVLWKLSLPAVLAMVLFGLNAFLDAVFVGQLVSSTALAALSLAYPLSQITFGLGSLIGVGAGTALSIALGANEESTLKRILGNLTLLSLLFSLVFAIPAWIYAKELVSLMGARGELLELGTVYFKATLPGAFFWIQGLATNMLIRGEGKLKEAAVMMAAGLLVNIILNPIFISLLDLGVAGAAWATNTGMLVYSIIGHVYFIRGKASFDTDWKYIGLDKPIVKSILSLGLPSLIMSLMGLIQALVVYNAMNKYGTDGDVAFFAAANRIVLFLLTPLFGLMRALQPVIGMNYGAQQIERVEKGYKTFSLAGTLIVLPFWIWMNILPESALNLMLPGVELSTEAIWNFRVYTFVLPFLPLVFMGLTFFPSVERGKIASILSLMRQLVFYVPVMLIAPLYFGVRGVFFGSTAIDLVVTGLIILTVRAEFKKLKNRTHRHHHEKIPEPEVNSDQQKPGESHALAQN